MYLYRLKVEGFRLLYECEFQFGWATFLIGANNCGKSSLLKAIDILLSGSHTQALSHHDYTSIVGENEELIKKCTEKIVITGEFRDVPEDALSWKGVKGRIFEYDVPEGLDETGKSITFRKVFENGGKVSPELLSKKRILKEGTRSFQSLLDLGVSEEDINEVFGEI